MKITLNRKDLNKLRPETREDLLSTFFRKQQISKPPGTEHFEWEGVVDFTEEQIAKYLAGCSELITNGLRVFAKHGPVIKAELLNQAGIINYGSFQGSCTKRARTVSKDKEAFIFSWDDWDEAENGIGHYAVSPKTYQSLVDYFSKEN